MVRYSRMVFHGDDSKRMSVRLSMRGIRSNAPMLPSSLSFSDALSSNITGALTTSFREAAEKKKEELRKQKRKDAPFQQLDFLVRDWQNFSDETDMTQCLKEIDEYRTDVFKERTTADLKETRDQIDVCYQNVGVFLLPNPGSEVMRKTYNGSIASIDPSFLKLLGFYVEHIFMFGLMPKLINNEVLFAEDFEACVSMGRVMRRFAVAYGDMFAKATLFPKALTILGATAEVNNNNATRIALEVEAA